MHVEEELTWDREDLRPEHPCRIFRERDREGERERESAVDCGDWEREKVRFLRDAWQGQIH